MRSECEEYEYRGQKSPILLTVMIDTAKVIELVEHRIEGSGVFLVDVKVGKANEIKVLVDAVEGVDIDECVDISKWLTGELDLIDENYSLEVSSPGIGTPFKVIQQYEKTLGREVEVVLKDGTRKKGKLVKVENDSITVETVEKVDSENSNKNKKKTIVAKVFAIDDIKSTKEVIKF